VTSSPIQISESPLRARGRSRYTAATVNYNLDSVDEPTTYAPKFKIPKNFDERSSTSSPYTRRKVHRARVANSLRQTSTGPTDKSREKYETYKAAQLAKEAANDLQVTLLSSKSIIADSINADAANKPRKNPIENETHIPDSPRAEALIGQRTFEAKQSNSIELSANTVGMLIGEVVVVVVLIVVDSRTMPKAGLCGLKVLRIASLMLKFRALPVVKVAIIDWLELF